MDQIQYLPIPPEEIATPIGTAIVGAWMLYPDDEATRLKLIHHFKVRDTVTRIQAAAFEGMVTISGEALANLVYTALEAASLAELERASETQIPIGMGAGLILYNTCLRIARKETSPMVSAIREIGEATIQRGHQRNSNHAHKAIWRRFKPVSALWAALVHLDDGSDAAPPFPCEPNALPNFLSLAEEYRKLGERTIPPRRSDAVLPPGIALRLTDDVLALLPGGILTVTI